MKRSITFPLPHPSAGPMTIFTLWIGRGLCAGGCSQGRIFHGGWIGEVDDFASVRETSTGTGHSIERVSSARWTGRGSKNGSGRT